MSSGKEVMKKLFKILPCFLMPLLVLGCATTPSENSVASNKGTSAEPQPSSNPVSSNAPTSSAHEHVWSEDYASDGTTHWKYCTVDGCNAKSEITAHTLGESAFYLDRVGKGVNTFPNPKKAKKCSVCEYAVLDGTDMLPELRFNFDPNDPDANFATVATKSDLSRPEVKGKFTLTNCDDTYKKTDVVGTMKVRGNQTDRKSTRLNSSHQV